MFAIAQSDLFFLGKGKLQGAQSCAFVRAIAERLILGTPTTAPPVVTSS